MSLHIRTLQHLAQRLSLSISFIDDICTALDEAEASGETPLYEHYDKEMGRKKKIRHIFNPSETLRCALVPVKRLLQEIPLPGQFVGGVPKRTIRDFAGPHVAKPWVYKLDIKNFYPSVTQYRVYDLFRNKLGCSPDVAKRLTRLTTAHRQLPQGFNTSTPVGNLVLVPCVERLTRISEILRPRPHYLG